jgi:hypothetical protein
MGEPRDPPEGIGDEERGLSKTSLSAGDSGRKRIPTRTEGIEPDVPFDPRQGEIVREFSDPRFSEAPRKSFPQELRERPGGQFAKTPRGKQEPINFVIGKLAEKYIEELVPERELPRGLKKAALYLEDESVIGRKFGEVDLIDTRNRVVYEVKPKSVYGEREGPPQAENYARILSERDTKPWRSEPVYWDREKAVQLLLDKREILPEQAHEYLAKIQARQEGAKTAQPRAKAEQQEPATKARERAATRPPKENVPSERNVEERARTRSAQPHEGEPSGKPPAGRRRPSLPSSRGFVLLGGALFTAIVSALGILASRWLQEKYLEDLAQLPVPPADTRKALDYLADPRTARGVEVLDLLERNWNEVSRVIRQSDQRLFAMTSAAQNRLLIADRRPVPERLADFGSLIDDVETVAEQFETVPANIDAILAIESRLQQTADHAQALEEYIHDYGYAGIALGLVPLGPDEVNRAEHNLRHIKIACRKVPADLRKLRPLAEQLADEWRLAVWELDRAYFGLLYEATARAAERAGAPPTLVGPARGVERPGQARE